MASAMRKIGVYLGLVEDDPMASSYDEYGGYREPERRLAPVGEPSGYRSHEPESHEYSVTAAPLLRSRVASKSAA